MNYSYLSLIIWLSLYSNGIFQVTGKGIPLSGLSVGFPAQKTLKYKYVTETMLKGANVTKSSNFKKNMGFGLSATVHVTNVWSGDEGSLIKLMVSGASFHSLSKLDVQFELQALPKLPAYFIWSKGTISDVYVYESDTALAANIKKGIISLFQLRNTNSVTEEQDTCGKCKVTYSANSGTITKRKEACTPNLSDQYTHPNWFFQSTVKSTVDVSYIIQDDFIESAESYMPVDVQSNLRPEIAADVNTRQTLKYENSFPATPVSAPNLEQALKRSSKDFSEKLIKGSLAITSDIKKPCSSGSNEGDKCLPLTQVVKQNSQFLAAGKVASLEAANAFLLLVDVIRANAKKADIIRVLRDSNNRNIIQPLIDALVAAQTADAQAALMEYLDFSDRDYIELPERYLLAVAFATHPSAIVVQDLLKLYEKNVPNVKLRESIGEALGAVLYTFTRSAQHDKKVVNVVQSVMTAKLQACTDDACRALHIRSLSNAGLADAVALLLTQAERANSSTVTEAALKAFHKVDRAIWAKVEVRDVLKRIFLQSSRGYSTSTRLQALKMLLAVGVTDAELTDIFWQTTDPYNTEFDVYVLSVLSDVARLNDTMRKSLAAVMIDKRLHNYNLLAPKGKSLSFTGQLADMSFARSSYLMYVENARSGIMKRSGMDVEMTSADHHMPIYSFGIFAAGLESLLGEVSDEGEESDVTAGLSLNMMGVALRPITFFTGKGSLMSALWSAPSELTSALQMNILTVDEVVRVPLTNGLTVDIDMRGTMSLDLSGSLSVSLWNKNAKSLIRNSAALVMKGTVSITTPPVKSLLEFSADARGVIDFKSDVDFYDKAKMCLQMSRPDITYRHNVTKIERVRGVKKGSVIKQKIVRRIPGISYPLPKRNNEVCREFLLAGVLQ